jgi:hypothetical protein
MFVGRFCDCQVNHGGFLRAKDWESKRYSPLLSVGSVSGNKPAPKGFPFVSFISASENPMLARAHQKE